MATIDYYASLQSPWTYLGHQRIVEYATQSQASLTIYPLNYGAVFSATGGLPLPKRAPERQAYRLTELKRWSSYLDRPLNLHPKHFPANEKLASHTLVALRELSKTDNTIAATAPVEFAGRVLQSVWVDELDISEEAVITNLLSQTGVTPEPVLEAARSESVTEQYTQDTEDAIKLGVFGAPSYVVDGELFWGQDRLPFVADRLGVG